MRRKCFTQGVITEGYCQKFLSRGEQPLTITLQPLYIYTLLLSNDNYYAVVVIVGKWLNGVALVINNDVLSLDTVCLF